MTTSSPDEQSTAATTASSDAVLPNLEQYQNKNNIDDQVFSAMSADGGLKVTVATIRNLLNEMMMWDDIQQLQLECAHIYTKPPLPSYKINISQHTMNPVPGGEYKFD